MYNLLMLPIDILKQLENLDLNDKEAKVYLASLLLGPASVQKISKESDIPRTLTYVILDSLMQKGLISTITDGKKRLFTAEGPETLERIIKEKQLEINTQKHILDDILPELNKIHFSNNVKPNVRFYIEREGIKSIRDQIYNEMNPNETIYGITDLDKLLDIFPDQFEYSKKRIKKNVPSLFMYTRKEGPLKNLTDDKSLRKSMYVPGDKFSFGSDISIQKNKVFLLSYNTNKPVGVVIEETEIASTLRSLFEFAWEEAKKYNK